MDTDEQVEEFWKQVHIGDIVKIDYKMTLSKEKSIEGKVYELNPTQVKLTDVKTPRSFLDRLHDGRIAPVPYYSILRYEIKSTP